eukprot:CAMPEP_0172690774 /NCGR_PEP_ID=MMETSP1074-20121228/24095_1 /TAXON_ID=2916 /ORGANISM="Ceratium fusus, Strain PA161109" /LENGTH=59 /DNA_ID=CAMNT_0013510759 /DNA_START=470 /DNA_END=649 /DNA_ORIENTATION=+
MTKKMSTPVKPPGSHRLWAWYTNTASTATARRPSTWSRCANPLSEVSLALQKGKCCVAE